MKEQQIRIDKRVIPYVIFLINKEIKNNNSDWAIIRVEHIVKNLKEQGVPMSKTRNSLKEIFLNNRDIIAPINTAERMILFTQTKREALKYNLKMDNYGWVMAFKFYKTVPFELKNKYL